MNPPFGICSIICTLLDQGLDNYDYATFAQIITDLRVSDKNAVLQNCYSLGSAAINGFDVTNILGIRPGSVF
jgi:hypothetical protein